MCEAGQLQPDDTIWHDGRVWWMTERLSTGEVVVSDAPESSGEQVRGHVFQPHDEVTRACMALLDARGALEAATHRMTRRRYGNALGFEIAAGEAKKAEAVIAKLDAARVIARYQP